MKKTKLSKAASLLLSLMLVLTLIPSAGAEMAFAADGEASETPETSTTAEWVNITNDNGGVDTSITRLDSSNPTWEKEGKGKAIFDSTAGTLTLEQYNYNIIEARNTGTNGTDITLVLSGSNTITANQDNANGITALSASDTGTITIKGKEGTTDTTENSLTINLNGSSKAGSYVHGIYAKKIVIEDGVSVTINVNDVISERYALRAKNGIEIKDNAELNICFKHTSDVKNDEYGIFNSESGNIVIDNSTVNVKTNKAHGGHYSIYNRNGGVKIKNGTVVTLNGCSGTTPTEVKGTAITNKDYTETSRSDKCFIEITGSNTKVSAQNYGFAIYEDGVYNNAQSADYGIEVTEGATVDISNCGYGIRLHQGGKVRAATLTVKTTNGAVFSSNSPKKSLEVLDKSTVILQSDNSHALSAGSGTIANFDLSTGGSVTLRTKDRTRIITGTSMYAFKLGNNTTYDDPNKYDVYGNNETGFYLWGDQLKLPPDTDGYYSIKFVPNKTLEGISLYDGESIIGGEISLAVPTKADVETTKQFTAIGTYDDATTDTITAEWTVTTTADGTTVPTGVSIDNTGKLTVKPDASAGDVYIKAKSGEVSSAAVKLTLTKATAELKELTITGPDAVAIPVASAESGNTGNYTCAGTDQYGESIDVTGVWSLVDAHEGVSINSTTGVLTVGKTAATTDSLKVKVTVGSISKEKTVKITKEASVVTKVEITGDAPALTVPEVTEISGTASTTVDNTYTAMVYDQYNAVMNEEIVVWSVSGNAGVSINASNGDLTVNNTATAASVTVTATCGDKADSKTVNVTRTAEKAKFVQILKGETPVTTDNIIIPTNDTPNTVTYGFKVYDQYGNEMTGQTVNWSATGTTEKVTFSDSTLTVAKGAAVGTVTVKAKVGDAEKTVTVNVNNKETVTITGIIAVNGTYDGSPQNGYTGTASSDKYTGEFNYSYSGRGTTSYGPTTTAPTNAGDYTLTVSVPNENPTYTGSETVDFTIAQKEVTVTAGTYKVSKVYDGTTTVDEVDVSGKLEVSGILEVDKENVRVIATDVAYTNANVDEQTTMEVTIALDGTGKGNYKLKDGATKVNVPCEITKATLTAEGTATATATYGTQVKDIEITGLTAKLKGAEVSGTWSFSSEEVPDVGTTTAYTAKFTPTTGAGNYNELTKEIIPTITKATIEEKTASGEAKYGASGTVDLREYIVEGGAATVDTSSVTDTDSVLDGTPSMEDKTLNFKFKDNAAIGKTAKIKVNVTSGNYNAYTVEVTVTVLDKLAQNIEASDINASYGDTVKLEPSGTHGAISYEVTKGTDVISVDESGNVTINKAGDAEITITAAGDDDYAVATKVVKVTIAKRLITVKANDKTMTVNGTLPTFDVTYGNFAAADTKDTVIETEAAAGVAAEVDGKTVGSFDITITTAPTLKTGMADKYDFAAAEKGVLKVNAAFSGGGGGFAAPTVQKPEIVIDETKGKAELSNNGTTASITANEGYEIEKVTVNGVDKGAVNKLTGLKTGDKVVVSFKSTAPAADDKATVVKQLTSKISKLQIVARSVKTSKKNVKVTLKTDAQSNAAIKEIKSLGYTVKYKFYRSTKKSSSYKAVLTKTSKSYTNTKGVKGSMYYYKARVQVFDKDGKLVAQTALKQCKYASRTWTK